MPGAVDRGEFHVARQAAVHCLHPLLPRQPASPGRALACRRDAVQRRQCHCEGIVRHRGQVDQPRRQHRLRHRFLQQRGQPTLVAVRRTQITHQPGIDVERSMRGQFLEIQTDGRDQEAAAQRLLTDQLDQVAFAKPVIAHHRKGRAARLMRLGQPLAEPVALRGQPNRKLADQLRGRDSHPQRFDHLAGLKLCAGHRRTSFYLWARRCP